MCELSFFLPPDLGNGTKTSSCRYTPSSFMPCPTEARVCYFRKHAQARVVAAEAFFLTLILCPFVDHEKVVFLRRVDAKFRRSSARLKTAICEYLGLASFYDVVTFQRCSQTPQRLLLTAALIGTLSVLQSCSFRFV